LVISLGPKGNHILGLGVILLCKSKYVLLHNQKRQPKIGCRNLIL